MTTETSNQEEAKKIWEQLEAEDNGTAEPAAPAEEKTQEPDTAQAVSESHESEVTEDDPKVLRDKLAGMESIITQLSTRLRNAEGHIGGLNSQVKQQLEAAKQVKAAGADAPSTGEIRAAQASPEAMAELERDYPEFAKALRPAIEATLSQRMSEFEKRIPQSQAQPTGDFASKQEIEAFKAELRVESKHPGWQEIVAKPEFAGWLQQGPRELQMLAGSNNPIDAIRLLDLYSEARKPSSPSQRNASAAALPTGTRSAVRTKNVDEMSPKEYWAFLDSQDKLKAT